LGLLIIDLQAKRNQLVTRSKADADIRNSSKNEWQVKREADPPFHHFICILILQKAQWEA
jgi:hypothetical protein